MKMKLPRFAPPIIPLARRKQTLAVLFVITVQLISLLLTILLFMNPVTFPLMLIYCVWAWFFDRAPKKGGRMKPWFRKLALWKNFRDYFPLGLHKTTDLDPNKNYIFGYHPHGIISLGAIGNFATEANDFSKLFPGIELRLLTLEINFRLPFFREYLMALGLCDVSRESCDHILNMGPGKSIMIVIGGAAESLDAHPKNYELTLANRKGFVRVALTHGYIKIFPSSNIFYRD
jgi:2-acylglycerol O-acyltransferase 2